MENIPSKDMQQALKAAGNLASIMFQLQTITEEGFEILMDQLLVYPYFSQDMDEVALVQSFVQEVKDEYERED